MRALFCGRLVFPLAKEMGPEIGFGISILERGQANDPRLILSSDRNVFCVIDLIVQLLQLL